MSDYEKLDGCIRGGAAAFFGLIAAAVLISTGDYNLVYIGKYILGMLALGLILLVVVFLLYRNE